MNYREKVPLQDTPEVTATSTPSHPNRKKKLSKNFILRRRSNRQHEAADNVTKPTTETTIVCENCDNLLWLRLARSRLLLQEQRVALDEALRGVALE